MAYLRDLASSRFGLTSRIDVVPGINVLCRRACLHNTYISTSLQVIALSNKKDMRLIGYMDLQ